MQNFGRENFDNSTSIRQIRRTFPPSKFCNIWYPLSQVPMQINHNFDFNTYDMCTCTLKLLTVHIQILLCIYMHSHMGASTDEAC